MVRARLERRRSGALGWLGAPACLLLLAACGSEPEMRVLQREQYVLTRIIPHPRTELGYFLTTPAGEEFQMGFQRIFDLVMCGSTNPAVFDFDEPGGRLALLLTNVEQGEPCTGDDTRLSVHAGLGPDGDPLAAGPLFTQGRINEAQIPLTRVNPPTLGFLPAWWRITALRPDVTAPIAEGAARALWRPPHLASTPSPRHPGSLLDELASLGVQPDFDVDGDGLERFETEGGIVARCIDGDRTAVDGADCVRDFRFVDAYEIDLLLKLRQAVLTGD